MTWIVRHLWLIPALPMLAAGLGALLKQGSRKLAAGLAVGSMAASLLLSLIALAHAIAHSGGPVETCNVGWLQFGGEWLKVGWMLDPLTA